MNKAIDIINDLLKIIKQADKEGFDISFSQIQTCRQAKIFISESIDENPIKY